MNVTESDPHIIVSSAEEIPAETAGSEHATPPNISNLKIPFEVELVVNPPDHIVSESAIPSALR